METESFWRQGVKRVFLTELLLSFIFHTFFFFQKKAPPNNMHNPMQREHKLLPQESPLKRLLCWKWNIMSSVVFCITATYSSSYIRLNLKITYLSSQQNILLQPIVLSRFTKKQIWHPWQHLGEHFSTRTGLEKMSNKNVCKGAKLSSFLC